MSAGVQRWQLAFEQEYGHVTSAAADGAQGQAPQACLMLCEKSHAFIKHPS